MTFDYIKRFIGTAIGFSLIGFFGFLMGLTLFPIIILFSGNSAKSQRRVRLIISYSFKLLLMIVTFMGLLKIRTRGLETLKNLKGSLIICNHPSLLDVAIILSKLQGTQCVVKNKLWKNLFLQGVVRAAGYIRNDTAPDVFLECCNKQLANGENILIFPEGTRSEPGQPLKLKRGVGNVALTTGANIQALAMKCVPVILKKGERWCNIPSKVPIFTLETGPFFSTNEYQSGLPRSLRVRHLMNDLQHYYNEHMDVQE